MATPIFSRKAFGGSPPAKTHTQSLGSWIDTISFGPDDPTAPATVREVTYDGDCPCWRASSEWMDINEFLG